jgi:hypothetical protein
LVLLSAAGAWGDAVGNLSDTLDLLTLLSRAFDLLAAVLGWQFLCEEAVGVGGEVEVLEYETVGLCPGAAWSQMLVVSPLLFQTIHQAYLDGLKCVPKWSRTGFSMSATAKASSTALVEGVARMLEPVRQCLYHLGTLSGEVFPPTHSPSSFAASLLALVEELLLNGESEDLPDAAQEEELVDGARYSHTHANTHKRKHKHTHTHAHTHTHTHTHIFTHRILHCLLTAPSFGLACLIQVPDAGQWLGDLVRLTRYLLCTRTDAFLPSAVKSDGEGLSQATLHLLQAWAHLSDQVVERKRLGSSAMDAIDLKGAAMSVFQVATLHIVLTRRRCVILPLGYRRSGFISIGGVFVVVRYIVFFFGRT